MSIFQMYATKGSLVMLEPNILIQEGFQKQLFKVGLLSLPVRKRRKYTKYAPSGERGQR